MAKAIDDLMDEFNKKQEKLKKQGKMTSSLLMIMVMATGALVFLVPIWILTEIVNNIVGWF